MDLKETKQAIQSESFTSSNFQGTRKPSLASLVQYIESLRPAAKGYDILLIRHYQGACIKLKWRWSSHPVYAETQVYQVLGEYLYNGRP